MKQQNELTSKAAKKIGDVAKNVATQSVGKSLPWFFHEVKVPEELRKK